MKQIPDTDLNDLVKTAAIGLLVEQRKEVDSIVRNILRREEIISDEIRRDKTTLAKKEQKLAQLQGKINKLKEGDWSVLAELEQSIKQEQKTGVQSPQTEPA